MNEKVTVTDAVRYHINVEFDNGFGVSVACNAHTYGGENGLFECAFCKFDNGERTIIDVLGFLDFGAVADFLTYVKGLPAFVGKQPALQCHPIGDLFRHTRDEKWWELDSQFNTIQFINGALHKWQEGDF